MRPGFGEWSLNLIVAWGWKASLAWSSMQRKEPISQLIPTNTCLPTSGVQLLPASPGQPPLPPRPSTVPHKTTFPAQASSPNSLRTDIYTLLRPPSTSPGETGLPGLQNVVTTHPPFKIPGTLGLSPWLPHSSPLLAAVALQAPSSWPLVLKSPVALVSQASTELTATALTRPVALSLGLTLKSTIAPNHLLQKHSVPVLLQPARSLLASPL